MLVDRFDVEALNLLGCEVSRFVAVRIEGKKRKGHLAGDRGALPLGNGQAVVARTQISIGMGNIAMNIDNLHRDVEMHWDNYKSETGDISKAAEAAESPVNG